MIMEPLFIDHGSTNVFSGTVDNSVFSTGSLVLITLQTPIIYTGGSLEIGIDWDASAIAGNPTTGTFTWLRDPSTNAQARGRSNSSAIITTTLNTARNAVYQTQFTYTGGVAPTCLPVVILAHGLDHSISELFVQP